MMNATGIGGGGLAISPDGANVYVTGDSDVAEFARTPAVHTLTVTLGGSGTGAVFDQTGAITCPTVCSNVYAANRQVTLTATPSSGLHVQRLERRMFGDGPCQVTMSADMQVTATFTAIAPPAPGAPTPALTGAPLAVTDAGAGFVGSVNPEGLATTVYFQYGLDLRYSQPGASGANYTLQTQPQSVGPDFSVHGDRPGHRIRARPQRALPRADGRHEQRGDDVWTGHHVHDRDTRPHPSPPTLGTDVQHRTGLGAGVGLVHGHLVPLTELTQIGPGATIDARHGSIELIVAGGGGRRPRCRRQAARRRTPAGSAARSSGFARPSAGQQGPDHRDDG